MKIETKFNIGDMVYCIQTANRIITCDMCEGMGGIADMELAEYECPKCNGMGTFFNGLKSKVIGPYKIIGIEISKGQKYCGVMDICEERYHLDNLDNFEFAPNISSIQYDKKNTMIFKEKEIAQHHCKNLNRRKK